MKDKTRLTGEEIRTCVLAAMIDKGVDGDSLAKAWAVRWPLHPEILGTSQKIEKGEKINVLTSIVYLAPATESVAYGGCNMCPLASAGCAKACLGANSKRLKMSYGSNSKAWKTLLWLYRPDIFKALLMKEIGLLRGRAHRKGMTPAVRLNGSADIVWEVHFPEIFKAYPDVVFYDYTKIKSRFYRQLPVNYHLTFSRSECNHEDAIELLAAGFNVAVVFENLPMAVESGFAGFPVFNGDETDYRPSDPKGVVVGLAVKADVHDDSGFIVNNGPRPKKVRSKVAA